MDGCRGYGGSDFMSLLDNSNHSLWLPSSSNSLRHATMMNFDQDRERVWRSPTTELYRGSDGDDDFEAASLFTQPEKKRRLTAEQVQYLEKNFEKENKLEPERKEELARQLDLQPRQVAIWFQNRRARFKTKKLEKEYDSLKSSYDKLKLDFEFLLKERHDLQNEVTLLTNKLNQKESGQSEMDPEALHSGPQQQQRKTNAEPQNLAKMGGSSNDVKQIEDASSAKSDVLDSESPQYTENGNHFEDPVDSTRILDPDLQSDFSQEEEDPQLMSLLSPTPGYHNLVKVDEPFTTYNFAIVDDQPIWPWPY